MRGIESQPNIPESASTPEPTSTPALKPEKEVLNRLGKILQDTYKMGANDSELPRILSIIEEYKTGVCTADEALKKADEIKNSKQDYH